MDDLDKLKRRLLKEQGAFLVARGSVNAAVETAKMIAEMAEAALLTAISVKEDDGRWFYTPFGGATWVQGEIDDAYHAAMCHGASAACWVSSAALAAWPYKRGGSR